MMPLDVSEIAAALVRVQRIGVKLEAALRKDEDGVVRLDPDERKDIGGELAALAITFGVDVVDGPSRKARR